MKKNIFLIGFMGAGKSTVASQLRRELHMELIEMDQMIVEQQGMSINAIFERFGEEHFRDLETELIRHLGQGAPAVISCGGGTVMRQENVICMKENGRIILLTAEPETIYQRVKNGKDRPILNGNMNVEFIRELMNKREARYQEVADITVATDGRTVNEICSEIRQKLAE